MKSYLRFLGRNKRYTAIQVVGLSVSLAFVIILASWLVNIVKMGRENPEYEDIYAVCYQNSMHTTWALGEHLSDNIPEIECTSTMLLYPGHFTLKNADCVKINWCEENFFEFFPREFIAGDDSFLKVPSEVGISETFANTYFPDGDAMGKTVTLLDKDYIITAIYKDFGDGLIKYNDMIMAMSARGEINFSIPSQEMLSGMVTMIKLKDGVDIDKTEEKVKEETIKHYTIASEKYIEAASSAQNNEAYIKMIKSRLADETCRLIRYDKLTYDEANQYFTVNTKFTIRIVIILVVLLLITALMNYVNLNVALAGKRAKEAAIKKLLGSQTSSVYLQFFKEAFVVTVFCTLLGVCLAVVAIPSINSMLQGYDGLGSRFSISFEPMTVGAIFGILIMTSILSGCVPAYYVSRFSALDVTKGSFRFNRKTIINKVFICIQTILATAFITFSIILQVSYDNMININSGCDHDDLFYLLPSDRLEPESNCFTHYDALQSELLTHPEIESVDYTNGTVFNCRTLGVPLDENFNQIIDAHMIYCTPEAFNIYGFKVISRNDNVQYGMWMTESFKKIFDNSQYLQQIMLDPSGDFGITGVIEDFSSSGIPVFGDAKTSGYVNVFPKQYVNDYNLAYIIRTNGDHEKARQVIAEAYEKISGCRVVDPKHIGRESMYLGEILKRDLQKIEFIKNVVTGIALMIVLIAVLGLIGMSIYYADESTHETAVRKVFGGTIISETKRTLWSFLKITLIANVVAVPVTVWLVMKQNWFDLATIPGWGWYVVLATMTSFAISLLAVLWQTLRAARTNPAEALKKE
ncbi:MAG: FtsX-like permease family protein [Bacteroidales bacterium]|nr:FtsX-like permease family protein [Bacteroidales bacterium]